jgi:sugar lactone lactonase YvrE
MAFFYFRNLLKAPTAFLRWLGAALACCLLLVGTAPQAAGQTSIITSLAGTGTSGYSGDGGPAASANFRQPLGSAVDAAGNVYIADFESHCIRKVNTSGIVTTVVGTGLRGYNGDNIPASTALLYRPASLALDAAGNLYIADRTNQRIRKVDTNGIITTIAGTGTGGYNGDNISATTAQLNSPTGVAVDATGNVYIVDVGNRRVRKVAPNGVITTFAGTGTVGYGADNIPATSAPLNYDDQVATGIAVDATGNVYIVDSGNYRIRKVDPNGIITTFAGVPGGSTADNIPATTAQLSVYNGGVAVDASGNVYIAEGSNPRIRKVDPSGIITTVAGTGIAGYNGDNIAATTGRFNSLINLSVDKASGNIYVGDALNSRLRKIGLPNNITTGALAAASYAEGASVAVPFTAGGAFGTGNTFTAQLSDAAGSFATPTSIGTLAATTTGTISATLPAILAYGTGYRVRVVGSAPATIGTNNGTNLTINGAQVTVGTLSSTSFPSGSALNIPYDAQNTFGAGNVFTAQLSDAAGSFATPTSIGTITSGGSGTISATLPAVGTTVTGYRIRIVSSSPAYTSADNGTNLTITAPTVMTAAINGAPFSAGSSVSVAFSTTGAFGSSNGFSAQLSDAAGSFNSPVTIGTGLVSPIAATIPTPVGSGTAYRIRVVASNPTVIGTDNGTNLVINGSTISTSALGASTYTAAAALSVPFTITGTYSTGNVFSAQLSNAAGSFANPVVIGTLASTTAGTISASIPAGAAVGTAYRVRVVSSGPAAIGTDNGTDFSITGVPNGLAFNGSNNYVTLASNPLATATALTFEAWVKWSGGGVWQRIFDFGSGTNNYIVLSPQAHANAGGKMRFIMKTSSGSEQVLDAQTALPTGSWQHVAVTTTAAGVWTIYVNGVQVGQATGRTSTPAAVAAAGNIYLGKSQFADPYFSGALDEVRFWNRALCQAEIQANMNKELAPGQMGLVAYYKMNQGIAGGANSGVTALTDASGAGNNGTLNSFALTSGNTTSNWVTGTVGGTALLPFVENNANTTQAMSGTATKTFSTGCGEYARITPAGAAPVTGSVTAVQVIDASVQSLRNGAYVQRHYDFAATSNPITATANVTLYFTQAEFDAYNAANGSSADLPTNPTDATGQAALRITQFHGTPTGGYAPANYPATWGGSGPAQVLIAPGAANVVWNSTAVRWEVTFPITGFSGFFVHTGTSPLPVELTAFTATAEGPATRLAWTTASEKNSARFEVERSLNGGFFAKIGEVAAAGSSTAPRNYGFSDATAPTGLLYYRLRPVDADGSFNYSPVRTVVLDGTAKQPRLTVYPTIAAAGQPVEYRYTGPALPAGATLEVYDLMGRQLGRQAAQAAGLLTTQALPTGWYCVRLRTATCTVQDRFYQP